MEVVLTGRNPSDCMKKMADYISEIHAEKHPFEKGIGARKGMSIKKRSGMAGERPVCLRFFFLVEEIF